MSLRARLSRAEKGTNTPEIYTNLQAQAAEIIKKIRSLRREANHYYDEMPPTWKEWDRLRQNDTFKNEARPEFIYSFDAFVLEFGTCTRAKRGHLTKINKHHTTWNKHNTIWGKRK